MTIPWRAGEGSAFATCATYRSFFRPSSVTLDFVRGLSSGAALRGVKPKVAHEVSNPHEAGFLASQRVGLALMPKSASNNLRKGGTVFRPFSADDLYAEIQLVFRDEPQTPRLASFVKATLRMRERLLRGKMEFGPRQQSLIPRPTVKEWQDGHARHRNGHAAPA